MYPKILIAENEPQRAHLLQATLESAGFQVLRATDSTNTWKIMRAQNLAMAIIDTNLPGLNKHDIQLHVRADPNLAQLPVLILGQSSSPEEAIAWLDWGADDHIGRTISPELLKAEVRAKLRRGKPHDQADGDNSIR